MNTPPAVGARMAILSKSPLCHGLSDRQISVIAANAVSHVFADDQIVFMQGHRARTLAMVRVGAVKTLRVNESGGEALLNIHMAGDVFGAMNHAATEHRASAVTLQQSTILTWQLDELLQVCPAVGQNLATIVFERLQESQQRFTEIATENVPTRLAKLLLRIEHGRTLPLSRQDIGQMTGTNLFTISRLFTRWQAEGLIVKRRGQVQVVDRAGLMARAQIAA